MSIERKRMSITTKNDNFLPCFNQYNYRNHVETPLMPTKPVNDSF